MNRNNKIKTFSLLMLVCFSLLAGGCSSEQEAEPLSFPPELFTVKAENNQEVDCAILLEDAYVEIQDLSGIETPVLKLQGSLPTICSDLAVKIEPPTTYKYIAVYLIAYTSMNGDDQSERKPFFISMPIHKLAPGVYTVVINEQKKFNFSFLTE